MKTLISIILIVTTLSLNSQAFEEVGKSIGVGDHKVLDSREMSGGIVAFDYNNDGWEDIFVVGGFLNNSALFKNMGDGTFKNVYASSGINIPQTEQTVGAAAADLDNDGYKELIVTTIERSHNYLFKNDNGRFIDISNQAGFTENSWSTNVTFIDYDLDGDLDIYMANYDGIGQSCKRNVFFKNLGDLKFQEIAKDIGLDDNGCGLASTISDYDNDGDYDIFLANDFGKTIESNKLFENQYPNTIFKDVSQESGYNDRIFGMGIEGGDYDEDGDMDYYTTNIGENLFHENNGDKTFTRREFELGIDNQYKAGTDSLATSWGIAWFDYDNDSYLDLFVSNGHIFIADSVICFADPNLLYRNNGNATFTEVGSQEGIDDVAQGRGIARLDYDNDGDMDIVQAVVSSTVDHEADTDDDRVHLYKNTSSENGNNWLQVKLKGSTDNRDAIGTRVNLYANGRKFIQESVSGGSSYMSMHSSILQFGLGDISTVDRVEAIFPNGEIVAKTNLEPNQRIELIQAYRTTEQATLCYGERFLNQYTLFKDTTIVDVVVASDGADSIITYEVDVLPEIKEEIDTQLCYGEEFKGETWRNDNQFTERLTSINGCDSVVTYIISVDDPVTIVVDTNVCFGGFVSNKRITRDLKLDVDIENPNGCDSILTYNVTVTEGPKYEDVFEVCKGNMYNSVVINSDTSFFSSFKTDAGCDSVYVENVVMLNNGIKDSTLELEFPYLYEGKNIESDTTVYKNLGIESANGCDSILAINLQLLISSVDYVEDNSIDFKYYPNPNEGELNYSFNLVDPAEVNITLYSAIGKKMKTIYSSWSSGYINRDVNLKELTTGIYFIKIKYNNNYQTHKLIVR